MKGVCASLTGCGTHAGGVLRLARLAGHLLGGKRKRKKRRKRKLPKSSSSCCRRPCAQQRHVPAVQHVDSVFASVVQQRQVRGLMDLKNCGRSAVAVHRWPSTFLSFRRGSAPWSSLFSRPQRFPCCCSISGGRCPCYAGRAISPVQVLERTVKIPQSQLVEKIVVALDFLTLFVDMPVVCNNRCFGSRSAENCGFAVAVHHGRRHSLRGTDAVHGLCDHGVSPVACGQGGR